MLIRVDERVLEIRERVKHVEKNIHGNGQPGLITRVKELEAKTDAKKHQWNDLAKWMAIILTAVMAASQFLQ